MKSAGSAVLCINGGSSSIRFAVYRTGRSLECVLAGKIERIGSRAATLVVSRGEGALPPSCRVVAADHRAAADFLWDWLEAQPVFSSICAVGHRVVHGLQRSAPALLTAALLKELHGLVPYAPEHLPREIGLIETWRARQPRLRQVACFDTAFHRRMPRVATVLPIPRRYAARGVQRYGFHGLSYGYLMEELLRLDPVGAKGRVILAHLGSGSSLAAVRGGTSIDTSMGFTPAGGLVMGTRSGDLDPGVLSFLVRRERMSPGRLDRLVNHESGLRGISGTGADVRDLLARENRDPRAAEALALFCYQAKKWIGSFAAALGGVDTVVFSGGIGENAAAVRARICAGLGFLGLALDRRRNAKNGPLISTDAASVTIRVIRTDEELMVARSVCRLLRLNGCD